MYQYAIVKILIQFYKGIARLLDIVEKQVWFRLQQSAARS